MRQRRGRPQQRRVVGVDRGVFVVDAASIDACSVDGKNLVLRNRNDLAIPCDMALAIFLLPAP
jgi:hypothetical protein